MASEYDFDVPAHWGYFIPDSDVLTSADALAIEEWFATPHPKLYTASAVPSRKSGGSSGRASPASAPVKREAREGVVCSVKSGNKGSAVAGSAKGGAGAASKRPGGKADGENDALKAMLAEHNKKIKKTTFEPRQHSVKDVKTVRCDGFLG